VGSHAAWQPVEGRLFCVRRNLAEMGSGSFGFEKGGLVPANIMGLPGAVRECPRFCQATALDPLSLMTPGRAFEPRESE
jgi:hypothetical protein